MCSTTCCAPSAIRTPTTMMPTSPTNARQPCSGLGRWTCISAGPTGRSRRKQRRAYFLQPRRVRRRGGNPKAARIDELIAADVGNQPVVEARMLNGDANACNVLGAKARWVSLDHLDHAPVPRLFADEEPDIAGLQVIEAKQA